MIKRQISFLFEDPGFCIDVFCTIAEPVRYYNRDTESGAWYSSTPDWNENGSLIREDLIFEVIADGVVCVVAVFAIILAIQSLPGTVGGRSNSGLSCASLSLRDAQMK